MTDWPRFPNAPIVEALLDIRASFRSPVDPSRLEAFQEVIRDRYPTKLGRVRWEGQIQVAPESAAAGISRRGPDGYLFKSTDGRHTVQARQDGYTFNWIKPYDRWEVFRNEAREHWERYRETFDPEAVTRLALRYINRLELPLPFTDFREYVKTSPDIAPGLPQGLSGFFMRLEIPDEARGFIAIVTETMEAAIDERKRLPFVLDIDVIRQATFEPSSPAIWDTFEKLRDFKNEIFFGSVTERAMELFR